MIVSHLHNKQRKVKFDLKWLRAFTRTAVTECLKTNARPAWTPARTNDQAPVLPHLTEVEISIVSDSAIAAVHAQFLDDPVPTDVITFQHGEILISSDTARSNAERFRTPLQAELGLYVIHGLLHLNGFLDEAPQDAARMRKVQTRILKACLKQNPYEEKAGPTSLSRK